MPFRRETGRGETVARRVIATSAGAFFIMASCGILMGALPAELAHRGISPGLIGLIVGCNALGSFAFRLFALDAIDRFGAGAIAAMAWCCSLVAALCLGAAMVLFEASTPMLGLGYFLQGVAISAYLTAGYTYLARIGTPQKRASRIGLYGGVANLGVLLALPTGVWLWTPGDTPLPWVLPAVLVLPAIALRPGDQRRCEDAGDRHEAEGHRSRLPWIALLAPLAGIGVSSAMQGGFEAHLPFMMRHFEAGTLIVELYACFGLAVAAGRLGGGWVADRTGSETVFLAGQALQAAALAIPFAMPSASGLLASASAFGAGAGMVGTAAFTLLVEAVPDSRSGAAFGLGGLLRDAGFAGGAAATGLVIVLGGAPAFLAVGIASTVASLVFATGLCLIRHHSDRVDAFPRTRPVSNNKYRLPKQK